jgi:hypothetical protein
MVRNAEILSDKINVIETVLPKKKKKKKKKMMMITVTTTIIIECLNLRWRKWHETGED